MYAPLAMGRRNDRWPDGENIHLLSVIRMLVATRNVRCPMTDAEQPGWASGEKTMDESLCGWRWH